ncbi:MAG: sigma 54-interacting transcriptional regulator [Myxococcales bacterium]|nr:sigma 54-interacting transcriptional regulator [Myxococcales bacterium]
MPVSRADLQLTTAHLAYLLDTCGDGFVVCDERQEVVLVNKEAERIFGYAEGELLGRPIQILMPERYRVEHEAGFARRLRDPARMPIRYVEVHGRRKDGSELPMEVRFSYTPLGDAIYFTGSVRDVSEQVAAREEIERLNAALQRERDYLREEVAEARSGDIVGDSPALLRALEQLDAVAATDANVLVQGESGVGKELFARALHDRSARASRALVRVNCASVPKELFESEFFGHVKGAFTGAVRSREGRFQLAHQGTLFLDEVGEIPLDLQGKLLRVLQEGELERIGDDRTRRVDVRLVAATNRDLKAEVEAGRFREDLYYRLSVFPIEVPPLRDRGDDVVALARHFLARACGDLGVPTSPITDREATQLRAYGWPGNIRELANVMERAAIVSRGGPLQLGLAIEAGGAGRASRIVSSQPASGSSAGEPSAAMIEQALERNDQVVARAARELGLTRQSLYRRMRRMGLAVERRSRRL